MRYDELKIDEVYINEGSTIGLGLEQVVEKDGKLFLKTIKRIKNYWWPLYHISEVHSHIVYDTLRELTPLEKIKYL